jgi:hypothetical protein
MFDTVFFVIGLIVGAGCVFGLLLERQRRINQQKKQQDAQEKAIRETKQALNAQREEFARQAAMLKDQQEKLDARTISYSELKDENTILKRDLQNIDVNIRKLQMDRDLQRQNQETLDTRAKEIGKRYLKENITWLGTSLSPNNYAASKKRLLDVIGRCRGIGFDIPWEEEAGYLTDLKAEYERIVRAAFEREEQARIRAQIREEQKREREIEQELKRLDRERAAIQVALDKALAEAKDKYSEEVEQLKAKLAEAEEKARRTISQAQITKSGHVYVISNIGSFGKDVFKIGMSRRFEPEMRVRELSGASVPFPYDVHMMISCDDAPTLENNLHRAFHKLRMNKANPRKEFFRTDIEAIRQAVEEHHGEVRYVADPEALEYNQSLTMPDEDSEFIEAVYETVEDDTEPVPDDE